MRARHDPDVCVHVAGVARAGRTERSAWAGTWGVCPGVVTGVGEFVLKKNAVRAAGKKITSIVTELDSRVHFGHCIHEIASYGHRAR